MSKQDLSGKIFNDLTVISFSHKDKNSYFWNCQCKCGNMVKARRAALTHRNLQSCGCVKRLKLTNKRFGKLVVMSYHSTNKQGGIVWNCICDCGNIIVATTTHLTTGSVKSCGCLRFNDLTGKKFGRLTVLSSTEKYNNHALLWRCQCECGKEKIVKHENLLKGSPISCGCAIKRLKNLSGETFGRLTLIKLSHMDKRSQEIYLCKCSCGNTKNIRRSNLTTGETKSCGCYQKDLNKSKSGVNSPSWKHDLTREERELSQDRNLLPEYSVWRQLVLQRDNFTCQITGQIGGKLCTHHIFNWANYKDLRFVVENGITLSVKIHKLFHKLYKKKNNTKEQFEEFRKRFDSGEFTVVA